MVSRKIDRFGSLDKILKKDIEVKNVNEIATDHHSHSDKRSFVSRYVFSTDHKVIAKQYLSLVVILGAFGCRLGVLNSLADRPSRH